MPRVNGNSPGAPSDAGSGASSGPNARFTGSPQDVEGSRSLPLIDHSSQRDVAVLAWGVRVALGPQQRQRRRQACARVARLDDLVHVPALRRHVGVGELLPVLADLRLAEGGGVRRALELAAVEDVDGALRA